MAPKTSTISQYKERGTYSIPHLKDSTDVIRVPSPMGMARLLNRIKPQLEAQPFVGRCPELEPLLRFVLGGSSH